MGSYVIVERPPVVRLEPMNGKVSFSPARARIAQLVEHHIRIDRLDYVEALGSNPSAGKFLFRVINLRCVPSRHSSCQ